MTKFPAFALAGSGVSQLIQCDAFQTFLNRLSEAKVYLEQGLDDGTGEIFTELLADIEGGPLSEDEKQELRLRVQSEIAASRNELSPINLEEETSAPDTDPSQRFHFGYALLDGHFYEEAITEFTTAGECGFQPLKCWECCGDCAFNLGRLDEARDYYKRVYSNPDCSPELKDQILPKISRCSGLSEPEKSTPTVEEKQLLPSSSGRSGNFEYGLALMDGQFWEEAIGEFISSANLGYEPLKSWEHCGDCASKLQRWEDAIGFYNRVYSDDSIAEELRHQILFKITKCSQTRKTAEIKSVIQARNGGSEAARNQAKGPEHITSSIFSLDRYSVNSVLGQTIVSFASPSTGWLDGQEHSYHITNLLYVGSSSLIVELEGDDTGKTFVGQTLTGRLGEILSPAGLAEWVSEQAISNSRHLVKVYDLAHFDGHFFLVREHFPLSLCDVLSAGEIMPISLAVKFGYQVVEALGDLHLHMGKDGNVASSFHLDLRPSRVLVRTDYPTVRIYNGGLWREIQRVNPEETAPSALPLHFLSYRAPEQFRPYLSRKRPPVFTDIYLFGVVFYEMLTGVQAFKASSYEEYEIQHCEQYPSPPKVWRPEIPDILNDLIMQCLQTDPMKRFRSTTQISLILEKSFSEALDRPKDDSYQRILQKLNLI